MRGVDAALGTSEKSAARGGPSQGFSLDTARVKHPAILSDAVAAVFGVTRVRGTRSGRQGFEHPVPWGRNHPRR